MKTVLTFAVVAACALSACSQNSKNVQATYVSPLSYRSFSCSQIEQEARRIARRTSQVAGVQDQNATGDAVATGVAVVLFWPAAFLVGRNKETSAELSRLKGEMEALEQASIEKNCGIVFQSAAPTQTVTSEDA